MRELILGTAGHIDHGKTALVRALTGVDTDRLPEEKRRGITIDLGFARLPLDEDVELGIVDVPGHEAFVRNMLAGATGMDLVLLVIAADEGVMPQTREHLAIVEQLGVRAGVVALTKIDAVDPEWLELVREDVAAALRASAFGGAQIVPVSANTGAGLPELSAALARAAAHVPARAADDLFRLPVDRVFTIRGTGTVVTGTVWSGALRRDGSVRVLPGGGSARLRSLQVHGREVDEVRAGQRAAVALAGAERESVERGDVLVVGDAWEAHTSVVARIALVADAPRALAQRQRVRFHLGTAEVLGRVRLLDRAGLEPGDTAWASIRLEAPVVARTGDRFVLRSYSPVTTIGGGVVVEPMSRRVRRSAPPPLELWDALLSAPPAAALRARLAHAAIAGVSEPRLPLETNGTAAELAAAAEELVQRGEAVRVGARLLTAAALADARSRVLAAVDELHRTQPLRDGLDREAARRALPPSAADRLADAAIEALLRGGELIARDGALARAGHEATLAPDQESASQALLGALEQAGLGAPLIAELPAPLRERADLPQLLKRLERNGAIAAVAPGYYVSSGELRRAEAKLRAALADAESLAPAEFRELFGVSRKYLIPLLEYFDRAGVTERAGDRRRLAAPRR